MTTLAKYDAMRTALQEAHRIDEVKDIRDKAEALRLYAKQAGEGLDNQNKLAEIKLRAERRCGELLKEMDRRTADDGLSKVSQDVTPIILPPKLDDLGISRMQSSRWQAIASVPEKVFDEYVDKVMQEAEELTGVYSRDGQTSNGEKVRNVATLQVYRAGYFDGSTRTRTSLR